MTPALKGSLEREVGTRVRHSRPLSGGDICQAYMVWFEGRENLFVKTRSGGPETLFAAEARGLDWLREAQALRVPAVVAATPDFLALEFLESGTRQADFEDCLGRGLAALHRFSPSLWGLDHDNFIGSLPQSNKPCASWPEFYIERRLRPLVRRAIDGDLAPRSWSNHFERLFQSLPQRIPDEPPSRLHGDLWAGNLHTGPQGEPCLIDPSVYAGHREVDLAMMRLFGGFGSRVFESYQEAYPLSEGHELRVPLYQLYPLLVHVNLFGGGYACSVDRALARLL